MKDLTDSQNLIYAASVARATVANDHHLSMDKLETPEQAATRARKVFITAAALLLDEEFTIPDLRRVAEALWGSDLDVRNFHRQWSESALLERTGGLHRGRGRPAEIYRLVK